MGLSGKILGGRDDHFCRPPKLGKKVGDVWVCTCGNRFTLKLMRGKKQWLQTGDRGGRR